MSLTGVELAAHRAPARTLGLVTPPARRREANEITRAIALAIGERVISTAAVVPLAQAVALLIVERVGLTGNEIVARAEQRRHEDPRVQQLIENQRFEVEHAHGAATAEAAIAEMLGLGRLVFGALGDRVVSTDASNALAEAISIIADEKVGLWRARR